METPPSPTPGADAFRDEVADLCNCLPDDIEDVYSCTALQEGMMAITTKSPTTYTVLHEYRVPSSINRIRLQDAWNQTAQANPALRTRIVLTKSQGCVQAVIRGDVVLMECSEEDDDALSRDGQNITWRMGGQLASLTLNLTRHILRVSLHHSICDAWSIGLLLRQVEAAYHGQKLASQPFRPLVDYIEATREEAKKFWMAELWDAHLASMASYPPLPSAEYTAMPSQSVSCTFSIATASAAGFPVNTKMRLAWAVLQSFYTGSDDVLFGAINVGRSVPVPGVEEMFGPALTSVPVRIQLRSQATIAESLEMVQHQWATNMPYEHIGLQNLLHMGPGPEAACRFQTLMSVEPRNGQHTLGLFTPHKSIPKKQELYPLVLICRPSDATIEIEALVDPGVISAPQAERILGQLARVYEQIEREPSIPIGEIDPLSQKDRLELVRRNISVVPSAPACVHDLISQRVQLQPNAPAISSWDGELSYRELHIYSSAVAARLLSFDIQPGQFVPLLMEKSKWVPVAMIAVLKAGGAFVLLEKSYPIPRLQQMCQALNAKLLLSSETDSDMAKQLGVPTTLAIDHEKFDQRHQHVQCRPPTSLDSPMYVTFTSGSTGAPKGVINHHAGYASSALAHGEPYHFTPQSRVLQFASPAFDSCIIEHLSTLIMGGCICIPTASDCLSNLAGAIEQFNVNVACLTPSVTRILTPDRVSSLRVLAFVGEAVLASDITRWKPFVEVRNAYGPAECSAVFSVQPQLQENDPTNIGFPTGCVGWVVHPQNHEKLMPLGCPGELVIEGPTVGHGYISNPEQTDRAFIQPPGWRHTFASSPNTRMYKTGDLVEYKVDGSFRYLGRKDTQVKLHGQRLELGEVEHHVCQLFPEAQHVVVEMLRSTRDQVRADHRPENILTAFVSQNIQDSSGRKPDIKNQPFFLPSTMEFRGACATAELRLTETLPPFMVPAVFLPITSVPLTPSGKTNRRQLREEASLLSWDKMQSYRASVEQPQRPSNECEDRIRQIWAECLNRPVEQISTSTSFFRLGGDSVSAMQAANSCRMAGWAITMGDIFRYPTITRLAERMQEVGRPEHLCPSFQDDPTDKLFSLSPIQKMIFDYEPQGNDRFTQQFVLRITRPIPASTVQEAIQAIVSRHSMLRARFTKDETGHWAQIIPSQIGGPTPFSEHFLSTWDDQQGLHRILAASQALLDIRRGPLIAVDHITTDCKSQYLGIVIHHLVVDYVSWRVILQDLEDILTTGTPLQPPSISFQQWCTLQQAYAEESLDPKDTLPSDIPSPPLDYWGVGDAQNISKDLAYESITVPRDVTQAILGLANDAFHTRPVEVIQSAVLYAFVQVFDDRQAPVIFSEGHGREPWDSSIDISRTVGWFTTMAPLFIDAHKGHQVTELLQLVKGGRRAMPSNGWAYFTSRYLHPNGPSHFQGHAPIEILFNYSGLFQQLERQDAVLQLAGSPDNDIFLLPTDLQRFALIDVSASVIDGSIALNFIYSRKMQHGDRIVQWIKECQATLESLPHHLQRQCQLTVSDFPLLGFGNEEQLQALLQDIVSCTGVGMSQIEDIYPCSPVQLGMWLGQVKVPGKYWSYLRWSVQSTDNHRVPVSIKRVQEAWQQMVCRHPILRTVFIDEHMKHDGSVACHLYIHHMLIDGTSRNIIMDEFHQAYDGILSNQPAAPYSSYISHLQQHLGQPEQYWTEHLNGISPCLFPTLSAAQLEETQVTPHKMPFKFQDTNNIRSFCRYIDITISSLLQVAWGLVLRTYTGTESVVFGYLSAGRDTPLKNVAEIVGPLISLLACRLTFDDDADLLSIFLENQIAYANSIDNQHGSMSEIVHSLGLSGQPLFNTAMSIQNDVPDSSRGGTSEVILLDEGGNDSTDYDIAVNISLYKASIEGNLTYDANKISDAQAELIADTLHHVVMQLIDPMKSRVGDVDLMGERNKDQIFKWNHDLPNPVMQCIHQSLHDYSLSHPQALAVDAWDNTLTYEELDNISSSWAQHLILYGVGPEVFVPVYCDRSSIVVVAALAILKAGGAFILLDSTNPKERLQDMLRHDFSCPVIITSAKHAEAASSMALQPILIEDMPKHGCSDAVSLAEWSPMSAAYAIFTSGSTGRPKACVIDHKSLHSAAEAQRKAFQIHNQSRVLQFSSYAFDACIIEIFTTLLAGGCVCVPSDNDRHRLEDMIFKFKITWTLLVTSVARTLDPRHVSPLETLVLGGEKMTSHDVRRWLPYVRLMNAYGPSECSMVSLNQSSSQVLSADPANIGTPVGGGIWVMHPDNPFQPVPVGAIGELVIDGAIVGRGYVNRPENMAASFLSYPDWMHGVRVPGENTLYRTGDLVRQLPDGSIRYVARRDRQVKLRGQRIELAEIEHHVQRCFPGRDHEVFVDIVVPEALKTVYLVASIASSIHGSESTIFERAVAQTKTRLVAEVPVFLIPNAFILLQDIPRMVNGKVDRRKLLQHASESLLKQINEPTASQNEWDPDSLEPHEQSMQSLWASVLNRPARTIGPDDNFFLLGGDSMAAMKLASAAGAQGLRLSVPQVFLHPRMKDLARDLKPNTATEASQQSESPRPFSLLPPERLGSAQQQAISYCNVFLSQIEDIYPCTPWQAAFVRSSNVTCMAQHRLRLDQSIDVRRLRAAWEKVAASDSILRTRLMDMLDIGFMQVVTKYEGIQWTSTNISPVVIEIDNTSFGKPLVQFEIYSPAKDRPVDLVITMHPALFDSHSLSSLLGKVESVYDESLTSDVFASGSFIEHIQSQREASLSFWQVKLQDVGADPFPSVPSQPTDTGVLRQMQSTVSITNLSDDDCTAIIGLAWGLVQSQYQGRDDIVFGVLSNGYRASISGAESPTTPTTAVVPFHMSIDTDWTISQTLSSLKHQLVGIGQFEQVELSEIASLGPGAERACSFQTLLTVETGKDQLRTRDLKFFKYRMTDGFSHSYPLQIMVSLEPTQLIIKAAFDASVIAEWQMQHILDQFSHMLQQVNSGHESLVRDIMTVNLHDMKQIKAWNPETLSLESVTVEDVVYRNCIERPFAPAVCAWDGDLSYEELNDEANKLTNTLIAYGIEPRSVIPIYMEPSRWVTVAILAILKAKAAFVLLDMSHPPDRLQEICYDVEASIVITTASAKPTALDLAETVVSVDEPADVSPSLKTTVGTSVDHSCNILYVCFTSGSTGKPKGVIIENEAFVTMAKSLSRKIGLGPHSRMLQISKYASDISIIEQLAPLLAGGCICIPSDSERKDAVGESVKSLQVTHVMMTPTRLRGLTATELRPVHTVMLIGETPRATDIDQWSKHMRVINLYGSAECTGVFTIQLSVDSSRAANIGRPIAGAAWIANGQDPHRPVPVGAVGELLLQGPLVGRRYRNNPEQTAAAFIPCPPWIQKLIKERDTRNFPVYRTGDLVRYAADGTFEFIGRGDWETLACNVGGPISQPLHHAPYSLVSDTECRDVLAIYLGQDGASTPNDVVDVLPTVEFQTYNITNPSLIHMVQMFNGPLDLTRLNHACVQVLSQNSILRSVFIRLADKIYQVIFRSIKPEFQHAECDDVKSFVAEICKFEREETPLQQSFIDFTVITSHTQDDWALMIRLPQAQCDEFSSPKLCQSIADAYNGRESATSTEFKDVVYHRLTEDYRKAFSFWRDYLCDASSPVIDFTGGFCLPHTANQTSVSRKLGQLPLPTDTTMATLVHGTLAFILAQYVNRRDITLTQVVHGRGGSLPNMDQVIGPCANHLPMRVQIDPEWTVADLLHHVQTQRLDIASYDNMTFGQIVENCTTWPADTALGCVVNHQTLSSTSGVEFDGVHAYSNAYWAHTSQTIPSGQICFTSTERKSGLEVCITASPDVMDTATAELLIQDLSDTIRLFVANPERRLHELVDEGFILISKSSCGSPASPGTPPN
ncbi:acetyl-CoA synthetase-like protein [Aspergillus ellipticus CBS 707.79]|uniref:Acetyl-CoA synthetase-like protein n=1 Tax=Aspergillus ellipticus CBS 707.79 TaxID=1448320 RepID=A0A319DIL2_9EURO|nr:acetyl-CoA synthetase-like protein [Aspergillus ellipticus CBS 707.79]